MAIKRGFLERILLVAIVIQLGYCKIDLPVYSRAGKHPIKTLTTLIYLVIAYCETIDDYNNVKTIFHSLISFTYLYNRLYSFVHSESYSSILL